MGLFFFFIVFLIVGLAILVELHDNTNVDHRSGDLLCNVIIGHKHNVVNLMPDPPAPLVTWNSPVCASSHTEDGLFQIVCYRPCVGLCACFGLLICTLNKNGAQAYAGHVGHVAAFPLCV